MNLNNIYQSIKKIANREKVTEEKIKEVFTESFYEAYKQREAVQADLHFEFSEDLLVYRCYQVVEKISNPEKEITRNDEILKKGEIKNNVFLLPIDTKNLSFSFSNELKKKLTQNLKKIHYEKENIMNIYSQGQIVWGTLQEKEEDYYVFNLGQGWGYWEKKEYSLLTEKLLVAQKMAFLVKEIKKGVNASQIILTRNDDLFVQKILEAEIPEIKNQTIIIRDILRIPNLFSKVIVESKDPRINAVGACIGKNSMRKESISQIIYPERIEIVEWRDNKKELFFNLISPSKRKVVISLIEKEQVWEVIVPQSRMSSILRQGGKVIEKIKNYLGKKIIFLTLEEKKKQKDTTIVWNGNLSFEEYQKI